MKQRWFFVLILLFILVLEKLSKSPVTFFQHSSKGTMINSEKYFHINGHNSNIGELSISLDELRDPHEIDIKHFREYGRHKPKYCQRSKN